MVASTQRSKLEEKYPDTFPVFNNALKELKAKLNLIPTKKGIEFALAEGESESSKKELMLAMIFSEYSDLEARDADEVSLQVLRIVKKSPLLNLIKQQIQEVRQTEDGQGRKQRDILVFDANQIPHLNRIMDTEMYRPMRTTAIVQASSRLRELMNPTSYLSTNPVKEKAVKLLTESLEKVAAENNPSAYKTALNNWKKQTLRFSYTKKGKTEIKTMSMAEIIKLPRGLVHFGKTETEKMVNNLEKKLTREESRLTLKLK